ncbi:type II toxin-antitoxin system VapC family toxin [Cyclobacterium roseum]|uniref:type II toxin-antitoxin system VapC family toxin n=1 Tax=Cyclobacterium roseum TaxID=2666137 RepID=UPI001391384D|nr:PIN domain-containing protein [Cyclobacterium roseum]
MKIFVDTAPFIYLMENNPGFAEKIKKAITEAIVKGHTLVTSVVTYMEFGVKPERENRQEVIQKFDELLSRLNIRMLEVDKEAGQMAFQMRAKYQFLKGMDALQIGLSIKENCSVFLTNDKNLKKIAEINVKTMDDL